MLRWIEATATVRRVTLLFILAGVLYAVMMSVTITRLQRAAGGLEIFDMRPLGYTVREGRELLSAMSSGAKDFYRYVQIPLDFVYPSLLGLFGAGTLALLRRRVRLPLWLLALPLLAALFDYLENIFVFILLGSNGPAMLLRIASLCSVLKSTFTTVFLTLILVSGVTLFLKWAFRRPGGRHANT